jgi:adenylyl-sulfate kinase
MNFQGKRGQATESTMATKSTNIQAVPHRVSREQRVRHTGHAGAVIWLTGLSGAGKSTLAMELEKELLRLGYSGYVLDGDNVRGGINSNLGFSQEDRCENIRRVGEVAALFADAGLICIAAFIAPYAGDRAIARAALSSGSFHEVYVKADLALCEARDPKGLYAKARRGELPEFTGISAPYEVPANPELVIDTARLNLQGCLDELVGYVLTTVPLSDSKSGGLTRD